jgi:pimeloyl-ACP methyl ester carboxylesterase
MAFPDRIIPAVVHDDGSVHHSSVMSHESDTSCAVCYMVPMRIIPVIFVPGIMGSNLKSIDSPFERPRPIWTVNSKWSIGTQWGGTGAANRKRLLDPQNTEVDGDGVIAKGTARTEAELRRRGWGEVAAMSYGNFLVWLENALNDADASTDYGRKGLRAELMKQAVAEAPGVDPLTYDEVSLSYKYQFPVHAVGYNWLQSNKNSAQCLHDRAEQFMEHYRSEFGYMCDKVILVTHSMGGLVARYYSEVLGGYSNVLGIVHGVMPATGAAMAYKRVKAGTEGMAGSVLGANAAEVTAVFAQSPGALQLLPGHDYGMHWLTVRDFDGSISLPLRDPYEEIYLQRGTWWGLIDDRLLNPLDKGKSTVGADWAGFEKLINNQVRSFHAKISNKYHMNTYAFYGDDAALKTWGNVTWKRTRRRSYGGVPIPEPTLSNPLSANATWNPGLGQQVVPTDSGTALDGALFVLQDPDERGDGTVPTRSGNAPFGRRGVQVCVPYPGVEHEGAYKDKQVQRFALWAITKIAYRVKQTSMAYKT